MKRWEVSVCKKAPADVRLAMKSEYEKQATDAEERRRSTEAAIAAVKPSGKRARMTDYLEGDAAAEKHEALRSLALMFAGCHIMEQIVDYPLFVNAIKDVARAGHGYVSRGQKYTGGTGVQACWQGIESRSGMMRRIYDIRLQLTDNVGDLVDADEGQLSNNDNQQICHILKNRWDGSLACAMHVARCILNPANQSEDILGGNAEWTRIFKAFISNHAKFLSSSRRKEGDDECDYLLTLGDQLRSSLDLKGSFGMADAIAQREKVKAGTYSMVTWNRADAPQLTALAVRVLSQPVSASPCERGWAGWESVHTARRNHVESAKCTDLVYVAHNWNVVRNWHTRDDVMPSIVRGNEVEPPIPAGYKVADEMEEGDDEVLADEFEKQLSSNLLPSLAPPPFSEISHNYLTGRALKPLAARTLDLSSNFLSGPLPNGACQPLSFDANCFTLPLGSALVPQRQEAACNAFCGVSSVAGGAAACGGHGVCYPQGPSLAPTCLCDAGFVRSRDIGCVAQGQNRSYSSSQLILPPASALTKGTQRETRGSFTAAPVTLFVYEAGQALSGCGLQLAFHANFSFSLFPQSGRVGFNGFAFVVSATDRVGRGTGVGYGGMDKRSEKPQKAVLERRLALCEVLQGGAEQHTFFFGFVACTTVKPFQKHVILESTVDTFTRTPAYGLQLLTNTYMPAWASPFPRYVSADYRVAPSKQDSWVVSDFHSWDSVPFLGWPVKDQKDCNACWAFALVASVEAAYGIATNGEAPQLSVESLFAAMGLTSKTFKYQDPCCYTGRLNHVVLVVSYFVFRNDGSQNRIAPPFWIIRNSWGVEWGDRGHMRMDIQGGDGVCGINVLPGIYPIVKMDVCGSDLKSPCYVGTCINDGKGSYSCICPPNYVESTIIDSFPTCDPGAALWPSNTTASTLAVSGSNWSCSDVLPLVGLSLAQFTQNNPSDTCWSISTQLGLTNSNLTALNPGLDCFEPIKASRSLCVERNATFAFTVPQCSQYGMLTPQDTCERLLRQVAGSEGDPTGAGEVNAMRWAELYRNNSGLICSDVIPITASAVGSNTGVQVSGGG
ncbi:unnamed protein product [Closterium sp. NIES-65]|nr:unnamed protein product [Closterium sp. NIES-65]